MNDKRYPFHFISAGLISLLLGLLCGLLAGLQYVIPDFIKELLPFNALRPLHTLFVVSWVLLTAMGGIYYYLGQDTTAKPTQRKLVKGHFWLLLLTGFGIAVSYLTKNFAGKEYLEFPSYFYFPIVLGWILFGLSYFKALMPTVRKWPVYYWMWATGIVFMIYHFTEAHLWLLPYFRGHFVQNVALQWKSGGSYVGSWNMLVYGSAIYIMGRISDDDSYARSGKAFFFYFLGLTNLMFGWAHHVYILPTAPWIRYLAYGISMTEWIILFSIIYDWKKSLSAAKKSEFTLAYQFIRLSDFWIFLNIILALLISIPAVNLFTHGTHITVAHAMGTTIGINTMILLASVTYILETNNSAIAVKRIQVGTRIFNLSFVLFWICLLLMGLRKTYWTHFEQAISFGQFQHSMHWFYLLFVLFGLGLLIGLYLIAFELLKSIKGTLLKLPD